MYLFAIIIIFIVCVLGIVFGAQNTGYIDLRFFRKEFSAPVLLVIIISFASGAVLAFILAIVDEIKLRTKVGKQKREIENLEKELGMLKTTPWEAEREVKE